LLEGDFGFPRSQLPRIILAFYYPWYYLGSWESPVLGDWPLTPYSSDSISTISHHVRLAKQAGIDGFISSWWGPNDYTDQNLQKLLEASGDMDFTVSIYFETLTGEPSHARPEAEILSWMRYFLETYGQDSRVLHLEGKPVIFVWAAGAAPLDLWRRVFDTLRAERLDAIYIANTLDPSYLDVFDGLHDYGSVFNTDLENVFQQVSTAARTYGWLEDDPQLRIWAATAQPGYDDTRIPSRDGAVIDRANGATYARTFEASINSDPDWILITSFNEWWEHTHIEPSQNFGHLYLELTAKYADVYKGFKPRAPFGFRVPAISDADGSVLLTWEGPLAQTPDSYNIYRSDLPITDVTGLIPLETGVEGLSHRDLPPADGKYHYAVTALFGDVEGPSSEALGTISSRSKSRADPSSEIPVDIAIYNESTGWVSQTEAGRQADLLIQEAEAKVNSVQVVSADALPEWVLSRTKNDQVDIILMFGDFPDSIYPSGNQQLDDSLAELFLDDGNMFLNTGDYIFWGQGRNGEGGLMNMMDISTTMWGENTPVQVTEAGERFTPSLQSFVTHRPFHLDDLDGTDWEAEVSFANNGVDRADPLIVRNRNTGGRIGIVYQTGDGQMPRAQVISEIILNWLPTVLPPLPWDVNSDGQVDASDLTLVLRHFGETVEATIFPNPDVNRDGIVNILDLVLVASHLSRLETANRVGQ
jgi:hypothetical protein